MHGRSGCLGSVSKAKLTSSVHEPLNEQKHLDHLVNKAKLSADFWTTSTRDMDNYSAAQSQGSISSISTSTQTHDAHGAANTNNNSEFVNHASSFLSGFVHWNQIRQQWVGRKIPENQPKQLLEPKLSWNATYDSLLGSNKPFPKRIPLAEAITAPSPATGPVTEDEIRAFLLQGKPVTAVDLVEQFKSRLRCKENKDAFSAVVKRICKTHKTRRGGARNFVLREGGEILDTSIAKEFSRLEI